MKHDFWKYKSLQLMSAEEWEALCDGCARCCLIKLQDDETEEVFYTNVACRMLDASTCRCRDYQHRQKHVATCMVLVGDDAATLRLLPASCAYRRLYERKPLLPWHPLVSGLRHEVHAQGFSVRGKVISEEYIHPEQLEDHVIDWIEV